MITPTIESLPGRVLSWAEQLDLIIFQQNRVSNPAFRIFNTVEFDEIMRARPYMTDTEMRKIAWAIHTDRLVGAVAEAVGRIRTEWLVKFN